MKPTIGEMVEEIMAEPYLPRMVACTVAAVGARWATSDPDLGDWASYRAVRDGWCWMREQQVERDRRGGR